MPQVVPGRSSWPKEKAALCGYSFAPKRAQNAPKPGSDTVSVPLAAAKCQELMENDYKTTIMVPFWLV